MNKDYNLKIDRLCVHGDVIFQTIVKKPNGVIIRNDVWLTRYSSKNKQCLKKLYVKQWGVFKIYPKIKEAILLEEFYKPKNVIDKTVHELVRENFFTEDIQKWVFSDNGQMYEITYIPISISWDYDIVNTIKREHEEEIKELKK